jgi:hypothetical protein
VAGIPLTEPLPPEWQSLLNSMKKPRVRIDPLQEALRALREGHGGRKALTDDPVPAIGDRPQ